MHVFCRLIRLSSAARSIVATFEIPAYIRIDFMFS